MGLENELAQIKISGKEGITVDIKTLDLPNACQVGIVVRDIDKAIAYYEKVWGIGPFVRPEISFTEKTYYGKPSDFKLGLGFCSLGPIEMELIQPLTGPTIHQDFLEKKGEGIHHIGFDVKDLYARLERYQKMGIKILMSGRTPAGGFAYLDTGNIGNVIVEIFQRAGRRA